MKKGLIILGAVVVAAALAAGSFYGGMAYQRNQENQIRANFFRSRGSSGNGSNTGGQGRGFFGGGGATGQVKGINGNVMTLSTPQNVVTVNLSSSTQIEKTTTGAESDLQPGERVIVTGQRDTSGNVAASQVLILGNSRPGASLQQNLGGQQNAATNP